MKASKRHLEVLEKRGKRKAVFAPHRKKPGAKALRKAVLNELKKKKPIQQAKEEQDKFDVNEGKASGQPEPFDAGEFPALAD